MSKTIYYTIWIRRNDSKNFEKLIGSHSTGMLGQYSSIEEAKTDLEIAIKDWNGQPKRTSKERRSLKYAQMRMIMEWKINKHILTTSNEEHGKTDYEPLPESEIKKQSEIDYINDKDWFDI